MAIFTAKFIIKSLKIYSSNTFNEQAEKKFVIEFSTLFINKIGCKFDWEFSEDSVYENPSNRFLSPNQDKNPNT